MNNDTKDCQRQEEEVAFRQALWENCRDSDSSSVNRQGSDPADGEKVTHKYPHQRWRSCLLVTAKNCLHETDYAMLNVQHKGWANILDIKK